jgi:mRNA interferase ChpB
LVQSHLGAREIDRACHQWWEFLQAKGLGLEVPIMGHDTTGVAICNCVCSFDIEARVRTGNASYIETLDTATCDEIVSRVISVIDPEQSHPVSSD